MDKMIPAGRRHFVHFSLQPCPVKLTTIHEPEQIERLKESTRNRSFRHTQVTVGELEKDEYFFTIDELGWVGFTTEYFSDTDVAGGVRTGNVYYYFDRERTKPASKWANQKMLLQPGTYYITAACRGSYDFYGYFLPCSRVITEADMVITGHNECYIRAKYPKSTSKYNFYLSEVPPANGEEPFFRQLQYTPCSTSWSITYKGDTYDIGGSLWDTELDPSKQYYLYINYPTTLGTPVGDQWKGWTFYVPMQVTADLKKPIEKATITGIKDQIYTGYATRPVVYVSLNGEKLNIGEDYSIIYKNNTKIGKGKVVITGLGEYIGTITRTYKIRPNMVTITSAQSPKGSRKLVIKWNPHVNQKKEISGYQVQYSTKAGFPKKATKLKTAKPSKTSYTIKKLKKKTRYCVRIRAYKKVGSKIYYGDWSNIKYVTIQ